MKKLFIKFLWFLADGLLKREHPMVVAITGPAGKTGTKEMIYSILSQSPRLTAKVGRSFGNLNTMVSLPLAILQIKTQEPSKIGWLGLTLWLVIKSCLYWMKIISYPQILILEAAADRKGDLAAIGQKLKPKVAILTSVGAAHLEFFGNVGNLLKEKLALMENMPLDGWVILPEKGLKRDMIDRIKAKKRFFNPSDLTAAARLTAEYFGLDKKEIDAGLASTLKVPGRLNLLESAGEFYIIDDTYNANPVSVKAGLEFLQKAALEKKATRKIAVLSDMLELGKDSKKWHSRLGRQAAKKSDLFIACGDLARYYHPDIYFDDKEKLKEYLLRELRKGDMILIKGSRGMKMEEVVRGLIDKTTL